MDSLITAAARALAAGDPLGALKRVALRDDAPALALRGIAMAQLGDLERAQGAAASGAARGFGPREAVARARCVVAEAEIALVSRDLGWPAKALDAARATLERAWRPRQRRPRALSRSAPPAADRPARRGRAIARGARSRAAAARARAPATSWSSPASRCGGCRRTPRARRSRARPSAARAARHSRRCIAEVESAARAARRARGAPDRAGRRAPAAARRGRGAARLAGAGGRRLPPRRARAGVSSCRSRRAPCCLRWPARWREAWPADVAARRADRARLRSEACRRIAPRAAARRDRAAARGARSRSPSVRATKRGFVLDAAPRARGGRAGAAGGRRSTPRCSPCSPTARRGRARRSRWRSAPASARVQRALDALAAAGKVQAFGRGRARRWMTPPVPGFTTTLLLPAPLPSE